jgi:uncharacterized SAM-binding protein YcdF (DUF218 family)
MFFISSKIIWLAIAPSSLLCALFFVSLIFFMFKKHRPARFCAGLGIVLFLFIGCTSFADRALAKWERQYSLLNTAGTELDMDNIAGVVLLGGGLDLSRSIAQNRLVLSHHNGDRIIAFLDLIQHNPDLSYIYSGGHGAVISSKAEDKRKIGEAEYARPFIDSLTNNRHIYYESKSQNTYQNAMYSKRLHINEINATWPSEKPWLLVTSAYHMPRAYAAFKNLGWNVKPYPSSYICEETKSLWHLTPKFWENWAKIDILAHEVVGMMAYKLTNKL